MVIDTSFNYGRGNAKVPLVPTRHRVTAANLSGEAMQQHQELMDLRNRANALKADVVAATNALAAANDALARANSENECLRNQIKTLGDENSRLKNAPRADGLAPSDDVEKKALNDVISALTEENAALKAEVERLSAKKGKKAKKAKEQPEQQATADA